MDKVFPISTYLILYIVSAISDILTFFSSFLLGFISDIAFSNIYSGTVVLSAEVLLRISNSFGGGIVLPSDIFLILIIFPIVISLITCEIFIIILASTENSVPKYYYLLMPFIAIFAAIPFISGYFFWITLTFYLTRVEVKEMLKKKSLNEGKKEVGKKDKN